MLASTDDEAATELMPEIAWAAAFTRVAGAVTASGFVTATVPEPIVATFGETTAGAVPRAGRFGSTVYVLYSRDRGPASDVYLQRVTLSGAKDGPEIRISEGESRNVPEAVIGGLGGALLLYSEQLATGPTLWAAFITGEGVLWQRLHVSTPGNGVVGYWDGFVFWLVYQQAAEPGPVRLKVRPIAPDFRAGLIAGQVDEVATSEGTLIRPFGVGYNGVGLPDLCAWSEATAPGAVIVRARAMKPGSGLAQGPAFDLSETTTESYLRSVATYPGKYIITWRTGRLGDASSTVQVRVVDMKTIQAVGGPKTLLTPRSMDLSVDGMLGYSHPDLLALIHRRTLAGGWDVSMASVPGSFLPQ